MKQFVCSRLDSISHKQGVNRMSRYLGKFSRFSKKFQCNRMHLSIHVIYVTGNALPCTLIDARFYRVFYIFNRAFRTFSHAETAHFTGGADRHLSVFFFHRPERTELDKFLIIRDFVLMYD